MKMIQRLGVSRSRWPKEYLAKLAEERHMDPKHLAGYADVKFVAKHTRESSQIVIYPFIVLLSLLIARIQIFDRWPWPWSYGIMLPLIAVFIALCSFSIRRAAKKVRDDAIEDLKSKKLELLGGDRSRKRTSAIAQIDHTIDEIKAVAEGAYAPWFLDRAAGAFLIPSAGALILNLVDALFSAGSW